jgi:hypothetical protein
MIDAIIDQHQEHLDWQYRCSTIQVNAGEREGGPTTRTPGADLQSSMLLKGNVTAEPGIKFNQICQPLPRSGSLLMIMCWGLSLCSGGWRGTAWEAVQGGLLSQSFR